LFGHIDFGDALSDIDSTAATDADLRDFTRSAHTAHVKAAAQATDTGVVTEGL